MINVQNYLHENTISQADNNCLSPRNPELCPTAGNVGIVVDEVALEEFSFRTFQSILVSIILFILHIQFYFIQHSH
jgi:hypothetical protein